MERIKVCRVGVGGGVPRGGGGEGGGGRGGGGGGVFLREGVVFGGD